MPRVLELSPSPHIISGVSVAHLMWHVVIALLPLCAFAVYLFGLAALLTLVTSVVVCVVTERLANRDGASSQSDGSVVVTGLIYGLTLPPGLPLWMTVVGGVIAVLLGKVVFGGLGCNAFNPALVGRAFLQAAFPAAMTSWLPALQPGRFAGVPASTLTFPGAVPAYDGLSGATPLASWKFQGHHTDPADLIFGLTSGSTGETSALLILLGGIYLVALKIANWRIPVAVFIVVGLVSATLHRVDPGRYPDALFALSSGGLMLGAVFMATDLVASPLTRLGCWLYGSLIGALIVVIRLWSGLPEGVMYAILLGNAVAPHIDSWIQPRGFGARAADHG